MFCAALKKKLQPLIMTFVLVWVQSKKKNKRCLLPVLLTFLGSVAESRPRTQVVSGLRKVSAGVKMQISETADFKGLKKKNRT